MSADLDDSFRRYEAARDAEWRAQAEYARRTFTERCADQLWNDAVAARMALFDGGRRIEMSGIAAEELAGADAQWDRDAEADSIPMDPRDVPSWSEWIDLGGEG